MVRNGMRVFLPLCQRCFQQPPQIGGGDYGEELEDKSQESASSDTEPEELGGPAGINAVGPQHVWRLRWPSHAWGEQLPGVAKEGVE
jgi:hypothetical protein